MISFPHAKFTHTGSCLSISKFYGLQKWNESLFSIHMSTQKCLCSWRLKRQQAKKNQNRIQTNKFGVACVNFFSSDNLKFQWWITTKVGNEHMLSELLFSTSQLHRAYKKKLWCYGIWSFVVMVFLFDFQFSFQLAFGVSTSKSES